MSNETITENEVTADKGQLPTVAELTRQVAAPDRVKELQKEYMRKFGRLSVDAQERYAHLKGIQDHYRHKSHWSTFLMFVMAGMIIFQSVLLGMVGAGVWDFTKYQWLLPVLLAQNLAQVIGLAVFVVKALFKDIKD